MEYVTCDLVGDAEVWNPDGKFWFSAIDFLARSFFAISPKRGLVGGSCTTLDGPATASFWFHLCICEGKGVGVAEGVMCIFFAGDFRVDVSISCCYQGAFSISGRIDKGHPYPENKLCLQAFCFLSHLFLHLYLFSLRLILSCPELHYLHSMVLSCLGRFSVVLKWLLHGEIPSRCFSLAMRLLHLW